jgi:hypothetical protein
MHIFIAAKLLEDNSFNPLFSSKREQGMSVGLNTGKDLATWFTPSLVSPLEATFLSEPTHLVLLVDERTPWAHR